MRVAISQWIAQHGSVGSNTEKIAAPSINSYAGNCDFTLCRNLQPIDYLGVESIYVPIHMPSRLDEIIVETSEFFLLYLAFRNRPNNGASTGGTEIDSKEIFFIVHCLNKFLIMRFVLIRLQS